MMPVGPAAVDDQIVPMHDKAPIDFSKVNDDNAGQDQIGGTNSEETFSGPEKARIEVMKQYFDVETVKLLLSKKWQNRKEGLEQFIKQIPKSLKDNGIAVQEHAIAIYLDTAKEKLAQILELNLELFETILEESKK